MSIIIDQNSAANIDTPSDGSSAIFVDQSGQLAVKQANGTSGTIPTVSSSNTQVIFNSLGNLVGSSSLTYATGLLSSPGFAGDGSSLTNINAANITGAVPYATTANSVAGANVSGIVSAAASASYAITAGAASTAGTVTTAAQPNITSVGTLTSLSVNGNLNMNSQYITNLSQPVNDSDAASKSYVDTTAQGLSVKQSAAAGTTGTLATASGGTVSYNNGASGVGATLTTTGTYTLIDSVNIATSGTRILVKNEANTVWNGIYTYTSGTVLTRSTDFDNSPGQEVAGAFVFIAAGTVNDNTGWVCTNTNPVTVGTSQITFTQFSGAGTYTAGDGLTLTGSQFSVNAAQSLTSVSASGNITANFFIGNGSQLTGLSTYSISNGTSNVIVTSSANVNISSAGTANVVAVSNNGATVSGTLVATGQTSFGGAAGSDDVVRIYRNNTIAGTVASFTAPALSFIPPQSGFGAGLLRSSTQLNISTGSATPIVLQTGATLGFGGTEQFRVSHTANAVNYVQITGNVTNGTPVVSAQGSDAAVGLTFQAKSASILFLTRSGQSRSFNIADSSSPVNYLQVAGTTTGSGPILSAQGTDTNIDLILTPKGSGNVSATANVIGGNLITGGLITATGNIRGGNLVSTAAISASGAITTGGAISASGAISAGGTITGTSLTVSGVVSATGNVTGNFFIGNGSQLTGLGGGTSISNGTSNVNISASGGNVTTSVGGTGNVVIVTSTGANVAGTLSVSGNITGANFVTSGSTGNITGANVIFANSIIATGTAGLGYGTGAGSTVTQSTSKSTTVTLNNPTGQITMNNASLAANTTVAFTCNNSTVAATDTVVVNITATSPSAQSAYNIWAYVSSGAISFNLKNISGSSYSDALIVNFAVIKGVTS